MVVSMICQDVIECLEKLAPKVYAESWDNPGLLTGRYEKEVTAVLLAVDVTEKVIEQAIMEGISMIISHHPLIFSPVKKVTADQVTGRRIMSLIQADISCYCMHTNFDATGMAQAASECLELLDATALKQTAQNKIVQYQMAQSGDEIKKDLAPGIGRVGSLPYEMTLRECAAYVKKCFAVEQVRVFGDENKLIRRAAVCPGSGKSMIEDVLLQKADVYITGDIDHHTGIDTAAKNLSIIDAGHYGLEKIFVPYVKEYLENELSGIHVYAAKEENPFYYV